MGQSRLGASPAVASRDTVMARERLQVPQIDPFGERHKCMISSSAMEWSSTVPAPSRRIADVAIDHGRISAVGRIDPASARRVINAEGLVVAPGIIDMHTHYDPQLTLDPFASSSCFHGVTSVVAGNCGFALAPTRAEGREAVKGIFSRVEEIDLSVLDQIPMGFRVLPGVPRSPQRPPRR